MKKGIFLKLEHIKDYFRNHILFRRFRVLARKLINWTKSYSLPGFFKIPIHDVFVFLINEIKRNDLVVRANSMAYSFFLSIFPSLMSLFTLLPFLRKYLLKWLLPNDGQNFRGVLENQIQSILPGNAGTIISDFIEDLVTNPRVGLLSFGFILAIFFSSNGMLTMMKGFEKSYHKTFKKRSGLKKRGIAILLTVMLGVLVITSVLLIILGGFIIRWITDATHLDRFSEISLILLRWGAVIFLYYSLIATIYRYGAAVKRKFNWFSPGATLASSLCILSSLVFSFYVDNFSQYNKLYGSFGTIIVTMLWIQINSLFLLIGFELNASIAVNRDLKKEFEQEEEGVDELEEEEEEIMAKGTKKEEEKDY